MRGPEPETEFSLRAVKERSRWLTRFARNVHSQAGEDGILIEALSLLPDPNHWSIEFGAWDGRYVSNTYNLVSSHGYSTVLVEGDPEKYRQLCSEYPFKDRAIFVNAYVGWSPENCLDTILKPYAIPSNPDLVSIDVDGNDYHIWHAMNAIRPKLLLIEYNPTMANSVEFVQTAEPRLNQGNSPASLVKLGKHKGYELIAATRLNLLFADANYFPLFGIADNSLEAMRDDPPDHVFSGYDGTIFVQGAVGARWHRMWLAQENVQVLPRPFRKYPPNYNRFERLALTCYQRLRGHRSSMSASEPNHVAEQRQRSHSKPCAYSSSGLFSTGALNIPSGREDFQIPPHTTTTRPDEKH